MRHQGWACWFAAGIAAVSSPAGAVDAPAIAGCYERAYDAAHLAGHKGQFVVRLTLSVAPPSPAAVAAFRPEDRFVADGNLKVWVRGNGKSFDSLGACRAQGDGLRCGGSLSAAEADTCRSRRDGVRSCRVDPTDAGAFEIQPRPDGVLVTVRERLELVPSPYDVGPYLSISASNAENRAFLLRPAPGACK
jgi:hypothetical protein